MNTPENITSLVQYLVTQVSGTNAGIRVVAGTAPVTQVDINGISDDQLHEMLSKCLVKDVNGKWALRLTTIAEDTASAITTNNYMVAKHLLGHCIGKDANGDFTLVLASTTTA